MYLTIPSKLYSLRPSICTIMVPSVMPSIDYEIAAGYASYLQPGSYPGLEELVTPSIII